MFIAKIKKELGSFKLDISLRLGREFTLLTGINGSGKSTLLKLIAGIIAPTEGLIVSEGKTFFDSGVAKTNLTPENRHVGYVAQHNTLFPWLTASENINFASADLVETEEIINRLGVKKILNQYPKDLSGGQSQLVALARTLATKPSLLLLDEPLSKVDEDNRLLAMGYIKSLQSKWNITVIMASHNKEDLKMCTKIVNLKNGIVELSRTINKTKAA